MSRGGRAGKGPALPEALDRLILCVERLLRIRRSQLFRKRRIDQPQPPWQLNHMETLAGDFHALAIGGPTSRNPRVRLFSCRKLVRDFYFVGRVEELRIVLTEFIELPEVAGIEQCNGGKLDGSSFFRVRSVFLAD